MTKLTLFEAKLTKTTHDARAEIGILAYPGSQLASIYGLTDLLVEASRIAHELGGAAAPGLRVTHWHVSADGKTMACDEDAHDGCPADLTVLIAPPTLKGPPETPEVLVGWLRERHGAGTTLCGICGGTFVLAETGLLRHRRVTTHWAYAEELQRRFPEVHVDADRLIIDEGDIVTAGGMMAWTDLGLRLIDGFLGPAVMLATARYFLIDPAWREQRFYSRFLPRLQHGDDAVLRVQHWLEREAMHEVGLAAMAAQAGLSERTFLRRFHRATGLNPTDYCQRLRVAKAREILELTNRTIDQVAREVGYEDAGSFRKVFQKVMGLRPRDYRKRFAVTRRAQFPAGMVVLERSRPD